MTRGYDCNVRSRYFYIINNTSVHLLLIYVISLARGKKNALLYAIGTNDMLGCFKCFVYPVIAQKHCCSMEPSVGVKSTLWMSEGGWPIWEKPGLVLIKGFGGQDVCLGHKEASTQKKEEITFGVLRKALPLGGGEI